MGMLKTVEKFSCDLVYFYRKIFPVILRSKMKLVVKILKEIYV